jgi:hypothetical protein
MMLERNAASTKDSSGVNQVVLPLTNDGKEYGHVPASSGVRRRRPCQCGGDAPQLPREMVGGHVTIDVVEAIQHHDITVVRGRYDGDYDKTNLPDELILTNYFYVEDGKIVMLVITHNGQSPY